MIHTQSFHLNPPSNGASNLTEALRAILDPICFFRFCVLFILFTPVFKFFTALCFAHSVNHVFWVFIGVCTLFQNWVFFTHYGTFFVDHFNHFDIGDMVKMYVITNGGLATSYEWEHACLFNRDSRPLLRDYIISRSLFIFNHDRSLFIY